MLKYIGKSLNRYIYEIDDKEIIINQNNDGQFKYSMSLDDLLTLDKQLLTELKTDLFKRL